MTHPSEIDCIVRSLLNAHGYLFQRRVEHEIRTSADWQVVGKEVYWANPDGDDGFADLVIARRNLVSVVECKRVRGSGRADVPRWAFIEAQHRPWELKTQDRLAWVSSDPSAPQATGWEEFIGPNQWPAADFCITRGEGRVRGTTVERIAQTLLRAQAAILPQVAADAWRVASHTPAVGLPMLITNARLHICQADSGEIDLERGELLAPAGAFQEVAAVRFRKSLGNPRALDFSTVEARWIDTERTIYVISAPKLGECLREIKLRRPAEELGRPEWELEG